MVGYKAFEKSMTFISCAVAVAQGCPLTSRVDSHIITVVLVYIIAKLLGP